MLLLISFIMISDALNPPMKLFEILEIRHTNKSKHGRKSMSSSIMVPFYNHTLK